VNNRFSEPKRVSEREALRRAQLAANQPLIPANGAGVDGRVTGTVKWFSPPKGYGFIVPDGGGADVYVHYVNIDEDGYRLLVENERVSYIPFTAERGPAAKEVRRMR
jgi:cold shock protein